MNVSYPDDRHRQSIIFKGMFLKLAPITIPLCIIVLVQNCVIFADYYKDRAKFVSNLFMGIALADILKAQGRLVLCVISVFVFTGYADIMVLYNSIFYYMITALPGVTCSKIYNMVLSVCLAINMANPFRRLNTIRLRKIVYILSLIITVLHICDTVMVLFCHLKVYTNKNERIYWHMYIIAMALFDFPGLTYAVVIYCFSTNSVTNKCFDNHELRFAVFTTLTFTCYVLPALIVLICMMIQIRYLRKSLKDSETLPSTSRHVSITVLLVSTLFFLCHATIFITGIVWFSLHPRFSPAHNSSDESFFLLGMLIGFVKFTLPLIYAVAYPIIIICRKPELKERYVRYLKRLACCCTPSAPVVTAVNDGE